MSRINVIPGTNPAKMLMPLTQLEVAHMQSVIDSCAAVLTQIANESRHSDSKVALADGTVVVVPTQTALAMAGLGQIFGIQFQSAEAQGAQSAPEAPAPVSEVGQPQAPADTSQDEAPPVRRAWTPTVLKGGKS